MIEETVEAKIRLLAQSDDVPERVKNQLDGLLQSISRPKRVSLLGPPEAGKNDAISFLIGEKLYDADLPLGSIELVYGAKPRSVFYLTDGRTAELDALPIGNVQMDHLDVEKTVIHAPVKALKRITIFRLQEANSLDAQVKGMTEIVPSSDYIIWCTKNYKKIEQKLWSHMPEQIHDQSIVIKTNFDSANSDLKTATSEINGLAGSSFAFARAVDLQAALEAQAAAPIDRAKMKQSGGAALISHLMSELNRSRENMLDQIDFILAKYPVSKPAQEASPTETPVVPISPRSDIVADASDKTAERQSAEIVTQNFASDTSAQAASGLNSLLAAVETAKDKGVLNRRSFVEESEYDEYEAMWNEGEFATLQEIPTYDDDDDDAAEAKSHG